MSNLTFELVTLDGLAHSSECYEVILPTESGIIAVFPNHAPLVSVSVPGVVSIRKRATDSDDDLVHFAVDGGVIEINERRVRLLADEADEADSIDEMQAQAALKRARELQAMAKDKVNLADATALIERQAARLKVAEIKRRSRKNH
ncbi:TPA: ATP synthase F1 subunit epsilon [Candidatus Saccharibacteria bacterium]|nr:ATP synthase F1 subunit epsilon [Candidatus Saccharibacteria bacterium]HIO87282.1 ATP synthase F1 subunit epsilon [Candidatus Saccharibacteria bacterium]